MKSLERRLGLAAVIAISMGAMLGSGLFVLPGIAAGLTGPSVWLAYLVAGVLIVPAAVCKAELATSMPVAGGSYVYIDRTFGPLAGTVAGLALWSSLLLKSSFALVGFGAYLAAFSESTFGVHMPLKVVALVLLCGITVLNAVGVQGVSKFQKIIVGVVVVSLAILCSYGAFHIRSENLDDHFHHGLRGFLSAVAFVVISFAGVTKIAAVGEEVRSPERNIPAGIIISLVLVALIYSGVTFVLVGVVPTAELGQDLRPIYTLGQALGGSVVGLLCALLGVVTMTSMANAGMLAASRFPFAMSRDALLPGSLARVHPQFVTPLRSVVLTAGVMVLAILFLDVSKLAKLAGSAMILSFIAINVSVIVLRESNVPWYEPAYQAPLYPFMQLFGVLFGIVILVMMGWLSLIALAVMVVPGVLLFFVYGRHRADRQGVMGQQQARPDLSSEPPPSDGGNATPLPYLEREVSIDTPVLIALFGNERSPETLIDLGISLAAGRRIEVVHLTSIPDITELDTVLDEDLYLMSLRRRVSVLADVRNADVQVDAVVTRDSVRTLYDLAKRIRCEWLVFALDGVRRQGITPVNPLGWLVNNSPAKLALFRDNGVRHIQQILAYPNGTHDDVVIETASHLADVLGGGVTWVGYDDEDGEHVRAQLEKMRTTHAAAADVRVVSGRNAEEAIASISPGYDLLVLGAPIQSGLRLRTTGEHRLTRQAACSVLRVNSERKRRRSAVDVSDDSE